MTHAVLLFAALVSVAAVFAKAIRARHSEAFLRSDRELVEPTPEQNAEVRRAVRAFHPVPVDTRRALRPVHVEMRRRRVGGV